MLLLRIKVIIHHNINHSQGNNFISILIHQKINYCETVLMKSLEGEEEKKKQSLGKMFLSYTLVGIGEEIHAIINSIWILYPSNDFISHFSTLTQSMTCA